METELERARESTMTEIKELSDRLTAAHSEQTEQLRLELDQRHADAVNELTDKLNAQKTELQSTTDLFNAERAEYEMKIEDLKNQVGIAC